MKPLTQNELHQVSGGVELATIAAGVVVAGAIIQFVHGLWDGYNSKE
jgi:class IIb bacteriocin, lactobin A/cerein 7B family